MVHFKMSFNSMFNKIIIAMKKFLLAVLTLFIGVNVMLAQEDRTIVVGDDVYVEMIFVKGGTFTMGCTNENGHCRNNEFPAHEVTLNAFYIGESEVTQELWVAVMGENPSTVKGDMVAVQNVSWTQCQEFINKLNEMTGERFRLPTEAEWEFAARGGNDSEGYLFSGSDDCNEVAWTADHSKQHNVARKESNELGIYDMSGNVWEWCSDWYGDYTNGKQTNPTGPSTGNGKVLRGGSWENFADDCRVTRRGQRKPDEDSWDCGLRLVLDYEVTSSVTPQDVPTEASLLVIEETLQETPQETRQEAPQNVIQGILTGAFSIGNGRQVYFSQGNLQYQPATETWRFADEQWNVLGENNRNLNADYEGWVDLLGWGSALNPASREGCGMQPTASWGIIDVSNSNVDGWFLMTDGDWNFLLNSRNTNSGIRYAKGIVHNMPGVIVLPDNWNADLYAFKYPNEKHAGCGNNIISDTDWTDIFEANGAVFLPCAGRRDSSLSDVGRTGYYWVDGVAGTQAPYESIGDHLYLNNQIHPSYGQSIRLVCPTDIHFKDMSKVQQKERPDVLNGKFSVSPDKKVQFSKGNLQHNPKTGEWRFAKRQWYRRYSTNGWTELFGWGTGNNPELQSSNNADYGDFNDWGKNIKVDDKEKEWFTLTSEEWNYLLNTRNTPSGMRYVRTNIDCVGGLILFPDDWNPSVYSFNNVNEQYKSSKGLSNYEWETILEPNGAVFLPIAGYRAGDYVDMDNSTSAYWSATSNDANTAIVIYMAERGIDFARQIDRNKGLSVRLVRKAE